MFERMGRFAARFRYPILGAWLVLAVAITLLAPSLSDVAVADQAGYLPEDEPSVIAQRIAAETFPEQVSSVQAVLVIYSERGSMHDPAQQAYLSELAEWLQQTLPVETVDQILAPTDPVVAEQLISEDGQVAMLFVGLNGSMEDQATIDALAAVQERLDQAPQGLTGYVTGGAAIAADYKASAVESAHRTTWITIVLVVTILLIIYRSPVSPLVPLATIGVAYLISRGLVAWLATLGWTISSITDIFMVVLLFGAGTDYCLFLVSRFREFVADGQSGVQAASHTVGRVGETITSSAGTVIVGMLAMSFAQMGLFASTGPSLAIAIAIALLAGLTLTPALLAALGKWAFWPGGARHAREGRVWTRLAHWVTTRPWVPLVLAVVVLVPLAFYGQGQQRSFDMLADLPDDVPSKAGYVLLAEHFGAGEMQPLDLIVTDIPNTRGPAGIAYVHGLTQNLLAAEGVADVRSLTLPAGRQDPQLGASLRVELQLQQMAAGMEQLSRGTDDPLAQGDLDLAEAATGLQTLHAYLDDLAVAFPHLTGDAPFQAAQEALDQLESALATGQQALLVSNQLQQASAGISAARTQLAQADPAALAEDGGTVEQLSLLRTYLVGLAQAQPQIAEMNSYSTVLGALDELEAQAAGLGQMTLVHAQLAAVAQEMEGLAQTLASDPLSLMPQPGAPSPAEQMGALVTYLEELGTAYPNLAAHQAYATARATTEAMTAALVQIDLSQIEQTIGQLQQGLLTLSGALTELSAVAAESVPTATFVPQTALPGASAPLQALDTILASLEEGMTQLADTAAADLPQAAYLPSEEVQAAMLPLAGQEMAFSAEALQAPLGTLQSSLQSLAADFATREDGFFIPTALAGETAGADLARLLDTYTSASGDAARLQIILAYEPFSAEAMDTVATLRDQVSHASRGYITGGTANYLDMREVMDRDTMRVMGLVVGGILIVLILLLRSLVAPIYMIGTILLSYGATLGLTRLVFEAILGEGLAWFVPFLILVVLVALGMDYNIFLMGRVKEEVSELADLPPGQRTRRGIEQAMQRTGGIITSAGIIMAGTFAAMMSSSLLGLVQLAFAVTVGILLDTFVIRTTLVPAIAVLLNRWSWWPGRGPAGAK